MTLAYKKTGTGFPVVILHGLYGMSDNWLSIARALEDRYTIYLPDLRNHGDSPHHESHTYADLVSDLYHFTEEHGIDKFYLIGHSMGGKAAMFFAKEYPEKLEKLVVVDISPVKYEGDLKEHPQAGQHYKIVNALLDLKPERFNSRGEIADALAQNIGSERVAQFLLKNIKRTDNHFEWKLNIKAIKENLNNIFDGIAEDDKHVFCSCDTLFIRGALSPYINDGDVDLIKKVFPLSKLVTIKNAGHWVHAEQPQVFLTVLNEYLE